MIETHDVEAATMIVETATMIAEITVAVKVHWDKVS